MNRDKMLRRLAKLPPKSGHAKVLRAKLGLNKVVAPVQEEVVPEPTPKSKPAPKPKKRKK
jgi:hypothetical protein